jgi:hypothetical protein
MVSLFKMKKKPGKKEVSHYRKERHMGVMIVICVNAGSLFNVYDVYDQSCSRKLSPLPFDVNDVVLFVIYICFKFSI